MFERLFDKYSLKVRHQKERAQKQMKGSAPLDRMVCSLCFVLLEFVQLEDMNKLLGETFNCVR